MSSQEADPLQAATDMRNGRRLLERHGNNLRYCERWGKWLVWKGTHWAVDEQLAIEQLAQETVDAMLIEAMNINDAHRKERLSHAVRCESAARLKNMIYCARSGAVQVKPADLNRQRMYLNCPNGTIDLETGNLMPNDRAHLITQLCPIAYDPGADCPTWRGFLRKIFAGDVELIAFVHSLVGYMITGDISEQVLAIAHGDGRNGKSTFVTAITEVLGEDYATKAARDLLLTKRGDSHPTAMMDLFSKRFASCIEVERGCTLAEALVKELTGGDKISGRRMREDNWSYDPTHKIFMAVNHKPAIRGTDLAIWRRVRLIPFNVTIPEDEIDKDLPDKLRAEYAGILAWAVQGVGLWRQCGLPAPTAVSAATECYRIEQDMLSRFVDECCVVGDVKVKSGDLYKAYKEWANGSGVLSSQQFTAEMEKRFGERKKSGVYHYHGVGLISSNYEHRECD